MVYPTPILGLETMSVFCFGHVEAATSLMLTLSWVHYLLVPWMTGGGLQPYDLATDPTGHRNLEQSS